MTWRYGELFLRRFHADRIEVQNLRLLHRPTLAPKGKGGGRAVSIHIDEAHGQVEMLPAFSQRRGVYDLDLYLAATAGGGRMGRSAPRAGSTRATT